MKVTSTSREEEEGMDEQSTIPNRSWEKEKDGVGSQVRGCIGQDTVGRKKTFDLHEVCGRGDQSKRKQSLSRSR